MAQAFVYKIEQGDEYIQTALKGDEILSLPTLNKGSAFNDEERQELGLVGRLPMRVGNLEEQLARVYENYKNEPNNLTKYSFLMALLDRNETLFYALASRHLSEMLPILYTPTVGEAVRSFSHIFQRPRGLFIGYEHHYCIDDIIDNRPFEDVDIVIVTDSEQILGIGDQGVGGIGIAVGKAIVYSLCAGIRPDRILPVVLDVGTDNEKLLSDPLYLGWRHPRIRGVEYFEFIERFVATVKQKLPNALLHWEDFGRDNARSLLERYRNRLPTFNDDIEGTGAIALAGLISGSKIVDMDFTKHRIVIFGAGSAGVGIADRIVSYFVHLGLNEKQSRAQIWALGRNGLLLSDDEGMAEFQKPYARDAQEVSSWNRDFMGRITLEETVRQICPTILIGASAQAGAFSQGIIETLSSGVQRPIVLVLSNPTSLAEARPDEIYRWSGGHALIATGSPFASFESEGKTVAVPQCNNALLYPGLGLGVTASRASRISQPMLFAAAQAVARFSTEKNRLLPTIDEARAVSVEVAKAVGICAIKEGLSPLKESELEQRIYENIWEPKYIHISSVKN